MNRIWGRSAGVLVAARAGRARLPKKKWRRERGMMNYKYKPWWAGPVSYSIKGILRSADSDDNGRDCRNSYDQPDSCRTPDLETRSGHHSRRGGGGRSMGRLSSRRVGGNTRRRPVYSGAGWLVLRLPPLRLGRAVRGAVPRHIQQQQRRIVCVWAGERRGRQLHPGERRSLSTPGLQPGGTAAAVDARSARARDAGFCLDHETFTRRAAVAV